jgi:hypothetical protein
MHFLLISLHAILQVAQAFKFPHVFRGVKKVQARIQGEVRAHLDLMVEVARTRLNLMVGVARARLGQVQEVVRNIARLKSKKVQVIIPGEVRAHLNLMVEVA